MVTLAEVVNKEFLVPRGLPGEVVTVGFGKVTEKRWPQGDLEIFVNPEVKKVRPSRRLGGHSRPPRPYPRLS